MSTDGSGAPLTRAQLRALRAAEEARAPEPASAADAADGGTTPDAAADAPVADAPAPDAAASAPAPSTPYVPGADTPDVGPDAAEGPTSGVSAPDVEPAPAAEPAAKPAPAASLRSAEPAATSARVTTAARAPKTVPPKPAGPRLGRSGVALLAVLGVLALVVGVLGAISLTQGPRLSRVQVDPAQAIDTSGSRVILTANQSLGAVDAEQVTVDPAVPFTVDAAGRSVGVRFTVPLDDSTKYTVSVAGVSAAGGGPAADLTTSFTTPSSRIFLLQRGEKGEDDKIFTTDLTGEKATPVFSHPRIDDYRVTSDLLVVTVEEDDGSHLLVMGRDGSRERELELPGKGYVSSVQVSDRGGLVGYSYSDSELTETSGRASVLVTQPLSGAGEPRIVEIEGAEASVADWRFVPDSSSLLFIEFDGVLGVEDPTADAGVQAIGKAASILGMSRGTYTAIVQRADASIVSIDLTTGEASELPASDPDYGDATSIEPLPDGSLRHIVQRDESGMPTGQAVVRVAADGAAEVISEVSGTDAILQVCASPSGQYAAVVVAPDLPGNPYDDLLLPLPTTLHTRLIDLAGDAKLPTLSGFDISWCDTSPRL